LTAQASKCGYKIEEFLLSPIQFGIPNSRLRYYLLATLDPALAGSAKAPQVLGALPVSQCVPLEDSTERRTSAKSSLVPFLEEDLSNEELIKRTVKSRLVTKYGRVMDVVVPEFRRSCCFTGGYTKFCEGTGSVLRLTPLTEEEDAAMKVAIERGVSYDFQGDWESLELRYFTPREILNLHCFPKWYNFPANVTDKQKFKLLGNSINARVVEELCRYILRNEEGLLMDYVPLVGSGHELVDSSELERVAKKQKC